MALITKYFTPNAGQTLIYVRDAEHIVKVERYNPDIRHVIYPAADGPGLYINFMIPFHGREELTIKYTQANGMDKAIDRLNE